MMIGIIRLLLTNRGPDCLLDSSQGKGLHTNVNSSGIVATLYQAIKNKGPGANDAQLNKVIDKPLRRSLVSMK